MRADCSTTTVIMAANPAASFVDILAAEIRNSSESDCVMPTNEKDVQAVLASFGEVFKKNRIDANVAVRADCSATTIS